jgi:hypothetical protein
MHYLRNGEGAFVVFKKWGVVDVLAHIYTLFFENGPFAMMQIGLVHIAM